MKAWLAALALLFWVAAAPAEAADSCAAAGNGADPASQRAALWTADRIRTLVEIEGLAGGRSFVGTGFLIAERFVITVKHNLQKDGVILSPQSDLDPIEDGRVRFWLGGRGERRPLSGVEISPLPADVDLALVQVDPVISVVPLPWTYQRDPDPVVTYCGWGSGDRHADVRRVVNPSAQRSWHVHLNGAVEGGVSGSPVLDKDGRAFGLITGSGQDNTATEVVLFGFIADLLRNANVLPPPDPRPPVVHPLRGVVNITERRALVTRPALAREVQIRISRDDGQEVENPVAWTAADGTWGFPVPGTAQERIVARFDLLHRDDLNQPPAGPFSYRSFPAVPKEWNVASGLIINFSMFTRAAYIPEMQERAQANEKALWETVPRCFPRDPSAQLDAFVACRRYVLAQPDNWFTRNDARIRAIDRQWSESFRAAADDPANLATLTPQIAFEGVRFHNQTGRPCDAVERLNDLFELFNDNRLGITPLRRAITAATACLRAGGPDPNTDAEAAWLLRRGDTTHERVVVLIVGWLRRFLPDPLALTDPVEQLRLRTELATAFEQYQGAALPSRITLDGAARAIADSATLSATLQAVELSYVTPWCGAAKRPLDPTARRSIVESLMRLRAPNCRQAGR